MNVNDVTTSFRGKLKAFMADKRIWAFWGVYTAISGAVFGVAYGIGSLLALRWWIAVVAIVGVGLVWGTSTFLAKTAAARRAEKE